MEIVITNHARERMTKYNIDEETLLNCLKEPDKIVESYGERKVYNLNLNGYVLRAVVEESKEIKTVVTVYKARRNRYEI
jgi:hypothetical protein